MLCEPSLAAVTDHHEPGGLNHNWVLSHSPWGRSSGTVQPCWVLCSGNKVKVKVSWAGFLIWRHDSLSLWVEFGFLQL